MRNGYYVYILHCADGTYYTGMTNNIERRFAEHEYGINEDAYTFSRRPLELVWGEKYLSARYAYQMERKIKKWSAAKKKALIDGRWDDLKNLARCLNKTSHEFWKGKIAKELPEKKYVPLSDCRTVCSSEVENTSQENISN